MKEHVASQSRISSNLKLNSSLKFILLGSGCVRSLRPRSGRFVSPQDGVMKGLSSRRSQQELAADLNLPASILPSRVEASMTEPEAFLGFFSLGSFHIVQSALFIVINSDLT